MRSSATPLHPPALRIAVISRAVSGLHGYGGLERHVGDLLKHLLLSGANVTLITRPPFKQSNNRTGEQANTRTGDRTNNRMFEHPNLRLQFIPYLTFPFAGRRGTTVLDRSTAYVLFGYRAGRFAAGLAARGEIDVVHGLGASCYGYARARRTKHPPDAPLVFNPQGLEEFGAGAKGLGYGLKRIGYIPLQRTVRACAQAADRVIATDGVLAPEVVKHLEVTPARVRVIPNAIDLDALDAFRAGDRRPAWEPALAVTRPVLLSVGRLEHNKGFHVLVAALRQIADLPWHWVLVGDGPYRSSLERAVRTNGLGTRVTFAGRVDDNTLHASYEHAALFVHPTLYEGSSLVTLEAMGHRRAVVATTAGGLPDKVRPGETGWLVPPGDATTLTCALRDALATPAQLPDMGRRGRALVEREFAWPAVRARLFELYRELVTNVRQPT